MFNNILAHNLVCSLESTSYSNNFDLIAYRKDDARPIQRHTTHESKLRIANTCHKIVALPLLARRLLYTISPSQI